MIWGLGYIIGIAITLMICGWFKKDDDASMFAALWPVWLVIAAVAAFFGAFYDIGEWIGDKVRSRNSSGRGN